VEAVLMEGHPLFSRRTAAEPVQEGRLPRITANTPVSTGRSKISTPGREFKNPVIRRVVSNSSLDTSGWRTMFLNSAPLPGPTPAPAHQTTVKYTPWQGAFHRASSSSSMRAKKSWKPAASWTVRMSPIRLATMSMFRSFR